MMGRFLFSATFVMASLIGVNVSAQETISKAEMRTAPPEQTHERLRDVIWEMFEERDYRRDDLGTRPLRAVLLKTKPHSDGGQTLCRHDRVVVSFAMVDADIDPDSEEASSASQMKARDLIASTWWGFATPPPITGPLPDQDLASEDLCGSLPEGHHFFRAPNGGIVGGYRSFMLLKRDIAAGREFELDCGNELACRAEISDLAIESLELVERCKPDIVDYCFRLEFARTGNAAIENRWEIKYDPDFRGNDPHIVSVEHVGRILLIGRRVPD